MPVVALDLFCGCGGVTYGLQKAGIQVALGTDVDEDCRLTYKLNNPSAKFVAADLSALSSCVLLDHATTINENDYLLIAACAPCQPFSVHNRFRDQSSNRTILRHVERIVRELRPDFLFLENVPGIQKVRGFSAFSRLLHALRALRYKVVLGVVDSLWYGIPQSRKRLVLMASLYGPVSWPEITHGNVPGLHPPATVRQAIQRYPPLEAGQAHPTIPNHVAASLTQRNLERIRSTPLDGGSRTDWPKTLALSCHQYHEGHGDVYGRLRWDAPAPTLTTKCISLSNGRYGHPAQNRAISAREAAALQGFDDAYVFYGGIQQTARQIGNAVPPILAERFGAAFVRAAESLDGSQRNVKWRSIVKSRRRKGVIRIG